jgi:hypothetical protein
MRRWSVLVALAFVLPASAQPPAGLALYIGPVPNIDGIVTPVPKDFANSYADLKKAHAKARNPAIGLVDDPAQADAILTVTRRGDVDTGTTSGSGLPPISLGGAGVSGTQRLTPTLLARLTIRATREGGDFSGVEPGEVDWTKWSTQAERIYKQVAAWLVANQDQLIKLRNRP